MNFCRVVRKPAITPIQQIARNHIRKDSLQSHQATNSPQSHTHKISCTLYLLFLTVSVRKRAPTVKQGYTSQQTTINLHKIIIMTKAPPCKHPGCKYSSRSKGLCSKHGTPRVRGYCTVDKCLSQCRGKERLCFRHRILDDSNTSPTVVKTQNRQICSIDGCDKIARGKHRLCSKHYRIKNNIRYYHLLIVSEH